MVDASTVWAAGEIVIETSDGGATWESRSNLDVYADTFSGVAVGPDGRVVAAGWYNPDEEGSHVCAAIAGSADGGASWTTQYEADYVDGAFTAVAFGAGSGVCAVGTTGAVVRSPDGGATWSGREPQGARMLEGIDFVDALHGWAVGLYFTPEAPSSLVLRTSDGGATWREAIFEKGSWSSGAVRR